MDAWQRRCVSHHLQESGLFTGDRLTGRGGGDLAAAPSDAQIQNTQISRVSVDEDEDFEIEEGKLIRYHGKDEEVTVIGIRAFAQNKYLRRVIIPEGVTEIEKDE